MLADFPSQQGIVGNLRDALLLKDSFIHELLRFLATQLGEWKRDPERPHESSETALTQQLCSYLNSASRLSDGWDILQFKVEAIDEAHPGRKIDLVASPCGPHVLVQGRRYTHYDTIIPVECKRLPTPKDSRRDEREYVIDGKATLGGMQRFKLGLHGAKHSQGAMIAYVQGDHCADWFNRIDGWIRQLATCETGWSEADALEPSADCAKAGMATYDSTHSRTEGLGPIQLRHLWIEMDSPHPPVKRIAQAD